jgi:hypothetical protein
MPKLPEASAWEFRTQPQWAAALLTGAGSLISDSARRPGAVVEGTAAHREFLTPAPKAGGPVSPGGGGRPSGSRGRRCSSPVSSGGRAARRPPARTASAWPSGPVSSGAGRRSRS